MIKIQKMGIVWIATNSIAFNFAKHKLFML
jgi:hypothetical protein